MEILIIHPGGLGDVILALPAAALLRDQFPSARITAAGNIDHLVPVLSAYVDRAVSISTLPLHHLYASGPVPESAVKFWRSFDRIISWTGVGDPGFAGRFQKIHPNVCVMAWRPAPGETRHVSRLFLDSLGPDRDAPAAAAPTPILLDPELVEEGEKWLEARGWDGREPLTALHPGAGSKSKRWPVSRCIDLTRHLVLQEKRKLIVVEGSAERGLAAQVVSGIPPNGVLVFDSMSLKLLSAVLAHCGLFIGNDSGVAHLAAALNVRCVVLFGPTLPQHWAPLGRDVTVLRNTRGCEGCASVGGFHTCLENITVEEVIGKARFEI